MVLALAGDSTMTSCLPVRPPAGPSVWTGAGAWRAARLGFFGGVATAVPPASDEAIAAVEDFAVVLAMFLRCERSRGANLAVRLCCSPPNKRRRRRLDVADAYLYRHGGDGGGPWPYRSA